MSRNHTGVTTEAVNLGDITGARFESGKTWTVLGLVRWETTTGDERVFIAKGYFNPSSKRQFRIRTANMAAPADLQVHVGTGLAVTLSAIVALNTWYLIACSNDGASGVTAYHITMSGTVTSGTGTHAGNATDLTEVINYGRRSSDSGDPMDGDIAHGCYVDAELTQNEILAFLDNPWLMATIWQRQYGVQFYHPLGLASQEPDWSGNGNSGTLVGSPTINDMPPTTLFTPKGRTIPVIEVAAVAVARRRVGFGAGWGARR